MEKALKTLPWCNFTMMVPRPGWSKKVKEGGIVRLPLLLYPLDYHKEYTSLFINYNIFTTCKG